MHKSSCTVLGHVDASTINHLLLVDMLVRAGFPSPANDYLETILDLTENFPSATYYIKALGDSMVAMAFQVVTADC